MMYRVIASKSFLAAATVLFVASVVCTQIPLLNYLGYEFSFFTALLAGFVCGLLAVSLWNARTPLSDPEYWNYVRIASSASLLVILIPFAVITANALFVKNCSFTQGFRLYVMYVVPSVLFSVSLGTLSSVVARRYRKTLFTILFLAILVHIPYVTLTRPQIFAYNPIVGYFPGFTYDESLAGELRLLIYRIGVLAATALIFSFSVLLHRLVAKEFRKVLPKEYFLHYTAAAVISLVACVGLYQMSNTLGLSSSSSFITRQLEGVQYTRHFKIVYPRKSVGPSRLRQIVMLHEYLFAQLSEEWQIYPRRPITVFIYESPQQKQRLVGAAATDFTKPWLREVNINLGDLDGALKHELVHAMLAEQGIPFLQVAPTSGLIEGAAVASERFEYDESLHQLAGQIFALGIHPKVAEMFSLSGFFKSYPGVSYVLAGSFCRYLIDRYGVERFKKLYRSGSFQELYRKNLDALVADWKTIVGSTPWTERDLRKAAYLFKRSPLFGKECARVIANLNVHTRELIDQKQYPDALASAELSLSLSRSTDAVFQKSTILFRLAEYDQAVRFTERELADSATRSTLLPLELTLGDSYWGLQDFAEAKDRYADLLADSLSQSMNEAAALRLRIIADSSARKFLATYFLEERSDSARTALLERLTEVPAADAYARYLLGREYSYKANDSRVIQELRLLSPMDSPILEYTRNRRIARAMYNLGEFERAKVYAWRALNFVSNDAQLYQLEDFLQRCVWIQQYLK